MTSGDTEMKIKVQGPTIVLDTQEFAVFMEQIRHACSVALSDLLVLGMPSPATSTGRLLTAALHDIETIQRDMLVGEGD
jgi:hypothetical protein